MIPKKHFHLLFLLCLSIVGQLITGCSGSKPFYLAKGTGSFKDNYKTSVKRIEPQTAANLTATTTSGISASDLSAFIQDKITKEESDNSFLESKEKVTIYKPSRKEVKLLKKRLVAVLDTTKKRERVTIQTNEKKVDELRNEVESLKNSVKTEKQGDKVVVSFDKPQTGLSKEGKILVIVIAALLLVGLLSLPIIGPVLATVLGIAVVAAALALVLGVIEIK